MASTSCHKLLVLFCLFLFFSSCSARTVIQRKLKHQLNMSPKSSLAKLEAEKLIRGLNLSPQADVNINLGFNDVKAVNDGVESASKIVERKFRFPILGDPTPGPSIEEFAHHAGYYKLAHAKAARMFYYFFESRNSKDDPVVVWLTGGPGCGSELAMFYENGPFFVSKNSTLIWNDYGWDKASNILFIDQPTGTGFSYSPDRSDLRHDETGVSNDLYDFIQAFFEEHPDLAKNDFYITGESYAGHYVPAFAVRVHQGNKANEGIHVNLKGFAIGNGLTNPELQYPAYPDFALNNSIISESDHIRISNKVPGCVEAAKACGTEGGNACVEAFRTCNNIFNMIMDISGALNYYDIRKKCTSGGSCYDFSAMERFFEMETVKSALGVENISYVSCSSVVYEAMIGDWMQNLAVGIPALLEDGINLLVYAGEYDLICNWLGNSHWVHALEWKGQNDFGAAPNVPFLVDGKEAGTMKSHGPLTFLKVYDAGHMVPMDQPKASLQMLQQWMQGKLAPAPSPCPPIVLH